METISIKKAAQLLNMSKKDVKRLMFEKGWTSKSDAVRVENARGNVAEICVYYEHHTETELRLTTVGMITLIEEVYHG